MSIFRGTQFNPEQRPYGGGVARPGAPRSRGRRGLEDQGVVCGPAHGLQVADMSRQMEGQGVPADLGSLGWGLRWSRWQ